MSMHESADNPQPRTAETVATGSTRVEHSLLCRRCGYDLCGLTIDGLCPECSLPVAQSSKIDETLASAEPAWLGKLRLGAWLVLAGIIGSLGMVVVSMVISAIGGFLGRSGDPNANAFASTSLILINTMTTIVLSLLMVIGAWLVTERDPGAGDEPTGLHARLVARIGLVVSAVTSPWSMYLSQSMGAVMTPGQQQATASMTLNILALVGIAMSIFAVIGWGAYCLHLSRLMRRLPSRAMSKQCRVLVWLYPISVGMFSTSGMLFVLILPHFTPGGAMPPAVLTMIFIASVGSCLGGVAYFIVQVWMAIVHTIFARRLGTFLTGAS